jgi:single-strand DNA-binding protein
MKTGVMTDTITLTGLVATEPKHVTTAEGLPITSFRLASSLRRFDRKTQTWVEVGTNWYTVSSFRRLAMSAAASVAKGDRVIVTGRLRLREWQNADKTGMSIEVDADVLGHDLNWGTAKYMRTMSGSEFTGSAADAFGAPPEGDTGSEADGGAGETAFASDDDEAPAPSRGDAESNEALAPTPF